MTSPSPFPAIAVLGALLIAATGRAVAAADAPPQAVAGPVEARVVKIRDGDTVEVEAFVWPLQSVHVAVRLRGIDAPETRGRCAAEKQAAGVATERLRELVGEGPVFLTKISGDKYFGRVLARLSTKTDRDLGATLLAEGLVARYDGGHRRDWCRDLLSDRDAVEPSAGRS